VTEYGAGALGATLCSHSPTHDLFVTNALYGAHREFYLAFQILPNTGVRRYSILFLNRLLHTRFPYGVPVDADAPV
jgi:hypothetical protein